MKLDLCKLFGVEEGEEFRIEHTSCEGLIYMIQNNCLKRRHEAGDNYMGSGFSINKINEISKIIKLPKKKQFTGVELCILKNIDKKYKYIIRDDDGDLSVYVFKPYRDDFMWRPLDGGYEDIVVFNHLFQNIQWEDEPMFIDDYVER